MQEGWHAARWGRTREARALESVSEGKGLFTRVARDVACARMERVRAERENMRSRWGGARKQQARAGETQEKCAHAVVR